MTVATHKELAFLKWVERGWFEIDGLGRIWRLKAFIQNGRGRPGVKDVQRRRVDRRISTGYRQVYWREQRVAVLAMAHRIVWVHANGPIPAWLQINHLDGVKDDNRLSNLEACTPRENIRHAIDVLGRYTGESHPAAKLTWPKVREIRRRRADGEQLKAIADDFNVGINCIHMVCVGRTWTK